MGRIPHTLHHTCRWYSHVLYTLVIMAQLSIAKWLLHLLLTVTVVSALQCACQGGWHREPDHTCRQLRQACALGERQQGGDCDCSEGQDAGTSDSHCVKRHTQPLGGLCRVFVCLFWLLLCWAPASQDACRVPLKQCFPCARQLAAGRQWCRSMCGKIAPWALCLVFRVEGAAWWCFAQPYGGDVA